MISITVPAGPLSPVDAAALADSKMAGSPGTQLRITLIEHTLSVSIPSEDEIDAIEHKRDDAPRPITAP